MDLGTLQCSPCHRLRQGGSVRVWDSQGLIAAGTPIKPRADDATLAPVLASCPCLQVLRRSHGRGYRKYGGFGEAAWRGGGLASRTYPNHCYDALRSTEGTPAVLHARMVSLKSVKISKNRQCLCDIFQCSESPCRCSTNWHVWN